MKPPKATLELGHYLVRELGIEDKFDTLGRWMAHYLAELMVAVENATTDDERHQMQGRAVEMILKIWDHRRSLPRQTYPFHAFDDVLKTVGLLRPGQSPFRYASGARGEGLDKHAADVFDHLVRLVIILLLMRFPRLNQKLGVDEAAYACLDEVERRAFDSIAEWSEMLPSTGGEPDVDAEEGTQADGLETDLRSIATMTIDGAISALECLRAHLGELSPRSKTFGVEKGDA